MTKLQAPIKPDAKLNDTHRRTLVRRLVRDALDALDEFIAERPDCSGRVESSLIVDDDPWRQTCVTVHVYEMNDNPNIDSKRFPLGTPKADVAGWLREFGEELDREAAEDAEYARLAARSDPPEAVHAG